jgi:thiamine-phosphate pyrophosphorylase
MAKRYPVPKLLLLSDARNDATLERALGPCRAEAGWCSGITTCTGRAPGAIRGVAAACRRHGHSILLSGAAMEAGHGARTGHAAPARLGRRTSGLRLATAHDLAELRDAARAGADAVLLFPFSRRAATPARACWDRSGSTCSRRCRACR